MIWYFKILFFLIGRFELADSLWYMEKKTLGETYLERCKQYSSKVKGILDQRFSGSPLDNALNNMRLEIMSNNLSTASVISGVMWFDNMTAYIDILKEIQDTMGKVSLNFVMVSKLWFTDGNQKFYFYSIVYIYI